MLLASFRLVSPLGNIAGVPHREGGGLAAPQDARATRSRHSGEAPRPLPESPLPPVVSSTANDVNRQRSEMAFSATHSMLL
jgi:hypothetical protein